MASKREQTESGNTSWDESEEDEDDRKIKAEILAIRKEKKLVQKNLRHKKLQEELAKEKKELKELKIVEKEGAKYDASSEVCKKKVDRDKVKKSKLKTDEEKEIKYDTSTEECKRNVDHSKGKRSKSAILKKDEQTGKEYDVDPHKGTRSSSEKLKKDDEKDQKHYTSSEEYKKKSDHSKKKKSMLEKLKREKEYDTLTEEFKKNAHQGTGKGSKEANDTANYKRNSLKPHHEKKNKEIRILDLSKIYEKVEQFISMEEYDKDLRDELTATFPNYMGVLRSAKRDLTRSDCGIVVTGETSAGKTSLINLIVQQKKLFVTSNLAATGKVCRIRNSDRMRLTLYKKDEKMIKEETVNDVKTLRKVVEKYTDLSACPAEFKDAYFVDVCLPVPILQGNVIIVDTPGIGETEDLDNILLDFLPHAVSFIFIVNAQNAGGIHEDRLVKIFKKIIQNRDKMPCFDPKDVLFLTNKWDGINDDSSDEDDEDTDTEDENQGEKSKKLTESEKTWNLIKTKLKKSWGLVSVEKIFRLSLKQIAKGMHTEFTEEFSRFQDVLKETIERNQNKRLKFYFNFLLNFIQNAERGTLARIHLLGKSEDEQKETIKKNRDKIQEIEKECKIKLVELLEYKNEVITILADRLHVYISSEDGKWKILRRSQILSESVSDFEAIIKRRFEKGIKDWCEGAEFSEEIAKVNCKIESYVRDIHLQIEGLETEMTGSRIAFGDDSFGIRAISYGMAFLLFGPLTLVFAVVIEFILAPFTWLFGWLESEESKRKKKIDRINNIYSQCLSQINRQYLRQMFDNSFGVEYTKSIKVIFQERIPQQLVNLNKVNERLLQEQAEIRKKQGSFRKLHKVTQSISEATEDFRRKHSDELGVSGKD